MENLNDIIDEAVTEGLYYNYDEGVDIATDKWIAKMFLYGDENSPFIPEVKEAFLSGCQKSCN